ncbi:MAG TPA: Ig-like domain-containing protein, partial [Candidatus Limnocylindria bacterium]|nr:Ig-like domain-containing protein [Candidatus Limnocylindria bacterium]
IDSTTGQPATNLTAPENITYNIYTDLHSERPNNPAWEDPVVAWALAHGYIYPPGGTEILQPPPTGQPPSVNILDPTDGQTITQTPFTVSVSALSSSGISRVDLSIDGQLFQSLNAQPFVFTVNKALSDGAHVLAARAVDSTGLTSDTSANITLSVASPLTLVQPSGTSLLQFPATLIAASNKLYTNVDFFYQDVSGNSTLIGASTNVSHVGDSYQYSFDWKTAPPAGVYKIYAKTTDGVTSKKVQITAP